MWIATVFYSIMASVGIICIYLVAVEFIQSLLSGAASLNRKYMLFDMQTVISTSLLILEYIAVWRSTGNIKPSNMSLLSNRACS